MQRPLARFAAWAIASLLTASHLLAESSTFRGDLRRTGAFDPPAGGWLDSVKWTFATRGPLRASPAFGGGLVVFGSGDGNLYALDAATGKERWRTALKGAVHSTAAIDGGVVYVTSRDGGLSALDLSTGKLRWNFRMDPDLPFRWGWDWLLSSPAIWGGAVYVGSGDGRLYALDARTGRERWRFETQARIRSSPAVADGVMYFSSRDGRVYALNTATGRLAWRFESEGATIDSAAAGFDRTSITSTPAVSGDGVFFGTRDGHEYAIERRTGALRWKFGHPVTYIPGSPMVSWVEASPALAGDLVMVGSSDGRLFHAVRARTGEEVWRFPAPLNVLSSAAVAGDSVLFGCDDGHLFALDRATGKERWRFRAGAGVVSSPVVRGGVIYVGSDDGKLYALWTSDRAKPARPRRAVYWTDPGPWKWFKGDAAVRDYFAAEGYEVLDNDGLLRFLGQPRAAESVVVMASDRFPGAALSEPYDAPSVVRYLAQGGRMVWLGSPPAAIEIDPKTGKRAGFDHARTERLLGIEHEEITIDMLRNEPTDEGKRWGLPQWWIGGLTGVPAKGLTVLAVDETGRATAWVKSFGGPVGSGFVRVWGRQETPEDLSWVQRVAEH